MLAVWKFIWLNHMHWINSNVFHFSPWNTKSSSNPSHVRSSSRAMWCIYALKKLLACLKYWVIECLWWIFSWFSKVRNVIYKTLTSKFNIRAKIITGHISIMQHEKDSSLKRRDSPITVHRLISVKQLLSPAKHLRSMCALEYSCFM